MLTHIKTYAMNVTFEGIENEILFHSASIRSTADFVMRVAPFWFGVENTTC